jgi:hypothetical protein
MQSLGRGALLLILAASVVDSARAEEDRRPVVGVCADFSEVGRLRTRLESDLGAGRSAEGYVAGVALALLQARYPVFRFQPGPEGRCGQSVHEISIALKNDDELLKFPLCGAHVDVLVRSGAGGYSSIRLPPVIGAAPSAKLLLHTDHLLQIGEVLRDRLLAPEEPPAQSLRRAMSGIPIPLTAPATVSARGDIETGLTFAELRLDGGARAVFEVEVGQGLRERRLFHACDDRRSGGRQIIAGPLVDEPNPAACQRRGKGPVTLPAAPAEGWKWSEIFVSERM